MSPEFDLVLYGATGFTGRLATHYIAKRRGNLRVAIAGRNYKKLEHLQKECENQPAIILADSSDPSSVEAMVQRTRVVLSFAGPFALYGEAVIAACAKHGRDYLDITGETPFIRSMIDRYQDLAVQTGARLVPFSGFDSIPADITVQIALQTAAQHAVKLDSMQFNYQIKGGFNGGTLETALNMGETGSAGKLLDGNILIPDKTWPRAARIELKPTFQPVLKRWTAPFLMAPINRAVVRRSAWLRAQQGSPDPAFHYEERMLVGRRFGALQGGLGSGALASLGLLSTYKLGRKFLRAIGPKPGEGPSQRDRDNGFFKGQLVASAQGRCQMIVSMERQGDPGNEVTIALAYASARLATDNAFEPGLKGFLTPTLAFGNKLRPQLEDVGFRFQTKLVRSGDAIEE